MLPNVSLKAWQFGHTQGGKNVHIVAIWPHPRGAFCPHPVAIWPHQTVAIWPHPKRRNCPQTVAIWPPQKGAFYPQTVAIWPPFGLCPPTHTNTKYHLSVQCRSSDSSAFFNVECCRTAAPDLALQLVLVVSLNVDNVVIMGLLLLYTTATVGPH